MKLMGIIGLDCSSRGIHAAILSMPNEKLNKLWCIKSTKKDVDERLFDLINGFEEFAATLGKKYIAAIEKPIYIQNTLATLGVAQVVAGVKLTLQNNGIFFFNVGNTSWKKTVVGKGNVGKKEIKAFAIKRWDLTDDLDQDYYDAVCISAWGLDKMKTQEKQV